MTTRETQLPLGKVNMEAAFDTLTSFSKNIQTIATELADYNKVSFERGIALVQELAGAKSFTQAMEIQTNYWKSSTEGLATEIGKLSDIIRTVAHDSTGTTPARVVAAK